MQNHETQTPQSSKRTRSVWPVVLTGFLLALSLISTLWVTQGMESSPWGAAPILLITLVNINITLVVVLLLLLSRNLVKLVFEKRARGPSFKNKLVSAFVGLSLIPCVLLFVVASGLLTSSIEHGLSVNVERSLTASLQVAQDYYAEARNTTTTYAQHQGEALRAQDFFEACAACIIDFLRKHKLDYDGLHLILSPPPLIFSTHPQEKEAVLQEVQEVLSAPHSLLPGVPIAREAKSARGEILRVLLRMERPHNRFVIFVVDRLIPAAFTKHAATIKMESEQYQQLARFKRPIQGSYILSFAIVVLLIIFAATWFGFYLARRITVPIEKLAYGTTAVAQGNLDVQIDVKANDELGVLVASFNQMTRDLRQSQEALMRAQTLATWKEVAQQMAHEIKNPLTPIQLATERLRRKYFERSPEFDQIFDPSTQTIITEVQQLVALVNEFSNFARLPPLTLSLQSILPIVQEVVCLYQAGHKAVTFSVDADQPIPPLRLDHDSVKRLLVNLFENALEALAVQQDRRQSDRQILIGDVAVSVTREELLQKVILTVSDNGGGIAPEDITHIFLPHFSRKKRGTGLGLAIAHRIMIDHGGRIFASPRKPQGTTLTVEFPIPVETA